jgi:ketosteroid isomerase-like protein
MSQENVEIVRDYFEAWNTGDRDFSIFHPKIVYHPRADEPDPSPQVGRDAYEELICGFADTFAQVTVQLRELIDCGDRVIASTVLHGRMRGGGEVRDDYVFVFAVRQQLVVEGWEYRTKGEAIEALGLSEQDAHADS